MTTLIAMPDFNFGDAFAIRIARFCKVFLGFYRVIDRLSGDRRVLAKIAPRRQEFAKNGQVFQHGRGHLDAVDGVLQCFAHIFFFKRRLGQIERNLGHSEHQVSVHLMGEAFFSKGNLPGIHEI